jgi:hypothetical protein
MAWTAQARAAAAAARAGKAKSSSRKHAAQIAKDRVSARTRTHAAGMTTEFKTVIKQVSRNEFAKRLKDARATANLIWKNAAVAFKNHKARDFATGTKTINPKAPRISSQSIKTSKNKVTGHFALTTNLVVPKRKGK